MFVFRFFGNLLMVYDFKALRKFTLRVSNGIYPANSLRAWMRLVLTASKDMKALLRVINRVIRKENSNLAPDVLAFGLLGLKTTHNIKDSIAHLDNELNFSRKAKQHQKYVENWVLNKCSTETQACSVEIHKRYVRDWWTRHAFVPLFTFSLQYSDIEEMVLRFLRSTHLTNLQKVLNDIVEPHREILA
jgi:hypothetical protein